MIIHLLFCLAYFGVGLCQSHCFVEPGKEMDVELVNSTSWEDRSSCVKACVDLQDLTTFT